jgi:hypothetical protein
METTTPIARYHHRHFVSAQPGKRQDSYHFTFRPFTGYETRPELNVAVYDDSGVSLDDRILLAREYEAARTLWSQAKFRLHAKPAITRAQPIWQEYTRARTTMDAAYAAFGDTEDNKWRAQLLKLADTHRDVLAAAQQWDTVAEGLARLVEEVKKRIEEQTERLREVGDLAGDR